MRFSAGHRLGAYEIVSSLGVGGMGEVYRAVDTRLGRVVAVKLLVEVRASAEARQRFANEARAASALNHPNIVTIYDIVDTDAGAMIVMEFLDGRTLAETIPHGGMPAREALACATQIADGLARAHRAGIVHRDLKPANIMVTAEGVVKLLDFGLAKFKVAAPDQAMTLSTEVGMLLGTVGYMSPEQAQGQPVDARTDVFSFGAVLYEMLTGERAFAGESTAAVLGAILRDEPRLLSGMASGWNALVRRCLEKDLGSRLKSMDEVKMAITALGSSAAPRMGPSIVLLPFTNLSPDKENEYFADGLTEEIIGALSKVSGLRVIARASSFRLRGETDLAKIGRMLSVAHTLDGSVRKAGNRVRIAVQLTRISDETPVWSERFDRDLTDIFAIQDEIAEAVVQSLEARLLRSQPANRPDVTAYTLGLRAQQLNWRVSGNGIGVAAQLYEEAIRVDPTFAAAYAGLASCLLSDAILGRRDSKVVLTRSRDLAKKAVQLDPEGAEGHTAVADGYVFLDRDWTAAGAAHHRAMELTPASFEVSVGYAIRYLRIVGRIDDAIVELRRVLEFDPLSSPAFALLGLLYWNNRQFELSVQHCIRALDLDDVNAIALWYLGLSQAALREQSGAVASFERLASLVNRSPWALGSYAWALGHLGLQARARTVALEILDKAEGGFVSGYAEALAYHTIGDAGRALDALERAEREFEPQIFWALTEQCLEPLFNHPRIKALKSRLNLAT